jgi:hypothetical protein
MNLDLAARDECLSFWGGCLLGVVGFCGSLVN